MTKDRNIKYRGTLRCDKLSFREAKTETTRVMELELPHRSRMRSRILDYAGFEDCQNDERGMFLA